MNQKRARKGEKLKARISFHGKFDSIERKAIASWLRRAADCLAKDPDYSEIRNFRLFY
jgi:hypothetical protein